MTEEQAVVVINATIYNWQRDGLLRLQDSLGVRSLSEALRSALSKVLPRPEITPNEDQEATA